jgi:hypothetical protein
MEGAAARVTAGYLGRYARLVTVGQHRRRAEVRAGFEAGAGTSCRAARPMRMGVQRRELLQLMSCSTGSHSGE